MSFNPYQLHQLAGIFLKLDTLNYVFLHCDYDARFGGHVVKAHNCANGIFEYRYIPISDTINYLRIEKHGSTLIEFYSADSISWNYLATFTNDFLGSNEINAGIVARMKSDATVEIPADFDYFSIQEISGTTVCGNVSGVWDSTGSPYYVTCDVTVPAGETLEIQPGVEVLFTGHYKFNVRGNLQAFGTEIDSIVFTRAFPSEESKWAGMRIIDASDTIRFNHCVVEYARSEANSDGFGGGGILSDHTNTIIDHCTIRNNYSFSDGGGALIQGSPYCRILSTSFVNNTSTGWGGEGGAGLMMSWSGDYRVEKCVFYGNSTQSGQNGGALTFDQTPVDAIVDRCTFMNNSADGTGGAICAVRGSGTVINVIAYGNSATYSNELGEYAGGQLFVSYSDIQGGYDGTDNIDEDPLFADPVNGDFHLTASSPCIDAGDPASPLDPDSTIADMGTFYYPQLNLLITPVSLNFGLLDLGTDSTMMISFYNPTVLPVEIDSLANQNFVFSVDSTGLGSQFYPQSTFELQVIFFPSASGTYRDTLVIIAELAGDNTLRIPLAGEAAVIPMPVDSLVIKKGPMNGIELSWAPVTETISGQPLTGVNYVIYGATDSEAVFQPFGFTSSTTYQHPFILNTQPFYFYYVEPYVEGQREVDAFTRNSFDNSSE